MSRHSTCEADDAATTNTPSAFDLWDIYLKLSPQGRREAMALVDALLREGSGERPKPADGAA